MARGGSVTLRGLVTGAIAPVLVVVWCHGAVAQTQHSGNPTFDRLVERVEQRFYAPARLDAFREEVARTIKDMPGIARADDDLTTEAIDRVLASLGASHTARYTPDVLDYYELADIFRFALRRAGRGLLPPDGRPAYDGIGIATRMIDGQPFVADVYDGGPADRAGLMVGDEILLVDGGAFSEVSAFRGKAGRTTQISIRRTPGGAPRAIPVPVERLRPTRTFLDAISQSIRVVTAGNRRIGVVRIWSYTSGDVAGILGRSIAEGALRDADGLVLDLRGRWGGAPADAAEMFVGGAADTTLTYRNGETRFDTVHWRRPLVAVIDDGTRSGMEILAYSLKKNGVPLVGTPTAGDVLAGTAFVLPDDSLLVLAVADVHVDGVRLEGNPVNPDIPVPFDIRYAAGRDPQLQAAIAEMTRVLAEGDGTN